jgi:hypothetical protein
MIRALPEQSTQGSRKDGKPASLGQAATPQCTGFQDPVFATGLDVFLVHIQGPVRAFSRRLRSSSDSGTGSFLPENAAGNPESGTNAPAPRP